MLQQVGLLLTSVWAGSPFLQRVPFPTEPFCLHSKAGWAPRGGGARGSPCPFVPPDGCPDLCNGNGRCTLGQNSWQCVCQSGWRGPGCSVAMETACADSKDNEGGEPGPGGPAPHSGCAGGSLQHRTGSCAGRDTQGARREAVPAPERSRAEQSCLLRAPRCRGSSPCALGAAREPQCGPRPVPALCSALHSPSGCPLLSHSPCRDVYCCPTAPVGMSLGAVLSCAHPVRRSPAFLQPLPACPLLPYSPSQGVPCSPTAPARLSLAVPQPLSGCPLLSLAVPQPLSPAVAVPSSRGGLCGAGWAVLSGCRLRGWHPCSVFPALHQPRLY